MTKEEKQRIYDAMLIRAWRKDVTLNEVRYWLRPYDICPTDPDLIRTKQLSGIRVQVFVGSELKPLADKLFDNKPVDDIKILNWLGKSGLCCQRTDKEMRKSMNNARYKIDKERKAFEYTMNSYAKQRESMTPKTKIKTLRSRHR